MREKKFQIFVSSTYKDLITERQAAVEAILSSGNIPAGMELFAAADESQMDVIKRWIDESDIYLLILGGRYGSIDKKSGKSYTQLEYEYAIEKQKPLFSLVINDVALDLKVKTIGSDAIEKDNGKQYKKFHAIVLKYMVKFWSDEKDIKISIHETLSELIYRKELIGWVRGDNSVNTGFLAEEIARLTKENADLRNRLHSQPNHISLYHNLTFDELSTLLQSENLPLNGKEEINLYKYLVQFGQHFINGSTAGTNGAIYHKLQVYNIIEKYEGYFGLEEYRFTQDGHRFYLKALLDHKTK